MDGRFCQLALRQALQQGRREIFNTEQGVKFTAVAFTSILKAANVRITVGGRGCALDSISVERLWRTVKWEHNGLRIAARDDRLTEPAVFIHGCAAQRMNVLSDELRHCA